MPTFCKKTCNDVNDSISFSEFHNALKEADVVLTQKKNSQLYEEN